MRRRHGPFRINLKISPRLRSAAGQLTGRLGAVSRAVQPAWQATTPAGRGALAVAMGAWLLGLRLGWQELFLVSA